MNTSANTTKLNSLLAKAKQVACISAASVLLAFSAASTATPISNMYVFGDSLSDTGALSVLAPQFCRPAPYDGCRFSNGPVWAEILGDNLGVSASTAYAGGTNFAIGGQRSDQVLTGQVPTFLASTGGVADADALYVIWIGGNDFLQSDPAGTVYDPLDSVTNVINSILGLSAAGANDFLIANLPIADTWALTFNAELANRLDELERSLNITQFDAFSMFTDMVVNADVYGFTNVTEPCYENGVACANPDEYLLWDSVHPTAAAHQFIANAALSALQVSGPATLAMFGLGLVMVVRTKRKTLA